MRIALFAAVALALPAVAPSAAAAQEGIHVDPGSPAGKEYALPLEQARREAKSGDRRAGGQSQPKSGSSALFGEGIKRQQSAGGSTGSSGSGESSGSGGGRARSGSRGKTARPGAAARLSVPAGSSGSSLGLTEAGIALAVLLAAGSLGLVLRRVLR